MSRLSKWLQHFKTKNTATDHIELANLFGLSQGAVSLMQHLFGQYSMINGVVLFGERALGLVHKEAPVQLAFLGPHVDSWLLQNIQERLEEMPLPYTFQLVHYQLELEPELKQHIQQHGKLIYRQSTMIE